MAFEIATELASRAPAAALNSASRPPRAAPVAAAARLICSWKSVLRPERSPAALVLDVAIAVIEWPDWAWAGSNHGPALTRRRAAAAAAPTVWRNMRFMVLSFR